MKVVMEPLYGELEIGLHRVAPTTYEVRLSWTDPLSHAEVAPVRGKAVIKVAELRALQLNAEAYGRELTMQLFDDQAVREHYAKTRAAFEARAIPLRVRISIDPLACELHALRWELLRDPETDASMAMSERILLSRFMFSQDWVPITPSSRHQIRALIAVAAPSDGDVFGLAPVDVGAEVSRARAALVGIETSVVHEGQPLTLEHLIDALRTGAELVYLVCHGVLRGDQGFLYFQDTTGKSARIANNELSQRIAGLERRPRLMVLASCDSGRQDDDSGVVGTQLTNHTSLAPLLAAAGVPAILAMQGQISMETIRLAMPVFFRELSADGQIDRALAVARTAVRGRSDRWMLALYLRLKSGRLWDEPARPRPRELFPFEILISMLAILVCWGYGAHESTPALPWFWGWLAGITLVLGVICLVVANATPQRRSSLVRSIEDLRGFLSQATAIHLLERAAALLANYYGRWILSWHAFRRSALVSVFAFAVLSVVLTIILGEAMLRTQALFWWPKAVLYVAFGWLVLNVASDFLSVACTRWLLRMLMGNSRGLGSAAAPQSDRSPSTSRLLAALGLDTGILLILALVPTGIAASLAVMLSQTSEPGTHEVLWGDYLLGSFLGGREFVEPMQIQSGVRWIVLITLLTACVPSLFIWAVFLGALAAKPVRGGVYHKLATWLEGYEDEASIVRIGYCCLAVIVVVVGMAGADAAPKDVEPLGDITVGIVDRNCKRKLVLSCQTLAHLYYRGIGVEKNALRSRELFEFGCDRGLPESCTWLGTIYWEGVSIERDQERASALWVFACDREYAQACAKLGLMYSGGNGAPVDLPRAVSLLQRACDGGSALGCWKLGHIYFTGVVEPPNAGRVNQLFGRAMQLFEQGCAEGHDDSCLIAANLYEGRDGVHKDVSAMLRVLQVACDLGQGALCRRLGILYLDGKSVDKDAQRAADYYTKACHLDDADGCVNVAGLLWTGNGVEQDRDEARLIYEKNCASKHPRACSQLGLIHLHGDGVPHDPRRACELFEVACTNGSPTDCHRLAKLFRRGTMVERDPVRAQRFLQLACDGGIKAACKPPKKKPAKAVTKPSKP